MIVVKNRTWKAGFCFCLEIDCKSCLHPQIQKKFFRFIIKI